MQVYIKPAIGAIQDKIICDVQETETVLDLKKKAAEQKRLSPNNFGLTFRGSALKDAQTMRDLKVTPGAEFILITMTQAGGNQNAV